MTKSEAWQTIWHSSFVTHSYRETKSCRAAVDYRNTMNYRIFETLQGYTAILFQNDICKRILLPSSMKIIQQRLKSDFSLAEESSEGVKDVELFVVDFFKGKDVSISLVKPPQQYMEIMEKAEPMQLCL